MKIALLSITVDGIYRALKELIVELINQRNEVVVIAPYDKSNDFLLELGCKLIDINISAHGTNVKDDYKLYRDYKSILKREQPDIAFTHTVKPNVWGGRACHKCGIPFFATVNGIGDALYNPGPLQKLLIQLYKFSLKNAEKVFFQNKTNQKMFIDEKIVLKEKTIIVAGSGINLNEHQVEPYPNNNGIIKFINIGRISRDKGVIELVGAIKEILRKYNNVEFTIIGNCAERYKPLLEDISKDDRVHYLGRVSYTQIHSIIKEHDAIVLPSYHEGIANVLLETAACGRAIIASQTQGCEETFDEGISGFGFEIRNIPSLVSAIEKFINLSVEEKEKMGIKGRNKIEKEFNRDLVLNKYIEELNVFWGKNK